MNGFGFIEYEDAMDARDVVPGKPSWRFAVYQITNYRCSLSYVQHPGWTDQKDLLTKPPTDGSDFKGERLTVQFARGPRRKENFPGPTDRPTAPRPRRTMFRMQISGLPETSWQVSSSSPSPLILSWISGSHCPLAILLEHFVSSSLCSSARSWSLIPETKVHSHRSRLWKHSCLASIT